VLVDLFGATPAAMAQKLVDSVNHETNHWPEPADAAALCPTATNPWALVARTLVGGAQGVMQVAITAPKTRIRRPHDQSTIGNAMNCTPETSAKLTKLAGSFCPP
jgi:PTS system ascorbate-specific IIA component